MQEKHAQLLGFRRRYEDHELTARDMWKVLLATAQENLQLCVGGPDEEYWALAADVCRAKLVRDDKLQDLVDRRWS